MCIHEKHWLLHVKGFLKGLSRRRKILASQMGNDVDKAPREPYDVCLANHDLPVLFRCGVRDRDSYVLSERDYFLYYVFLFAASAGDTERKMLLNGQVLVPKRLEAAISARSKHNDSPKGISRSVYSARDNVPVTSPRNSMPKLPASGSNELKNAAQSTSPRPEHHRLTKEKDRLPSLRLLLPKSIAEVPCPEIFTAVAPFIIHKGGSVKLHTSVRSKAQNFANYTSNHSHTCKATALRIVREYLLSQDVQAAAQAIINTLETLAPDVPPLNYAINYRPSAASLLSIRLAVVLSKKVTIIGPWFSLPCTFLYPHEWKHLLDVGLDLLQVTGPRSNQQFYLYWFINDLSLESLCEVSYTIEDIVRGLSSGPETEKKLAYVTTERAKLKQTILQIPNPALIMIYTALDRYILKSQP